MQFEVLSFQFTSDRKRQPGNRTDARDGGLLFSRPRSGACAGSGGPSVGWSVMLGFDR